MRLRIGFAAALLAACVPVPACSSDVTGSPTVARSRAEVPRTAASAQASACREASLNESPTEPSLWKPSATPVPAGIPETGFGAADAECEGTFARQSDIVLLVWRRTFPVAELHALATRLEARGWHGVDQARDGGVYAAPRGLPAMYRTGPGQLHYLTLNTNQRPALTVLLWL